MKRKWNRGMRPITREQLPYLLLAVAGMIEFLFITLEGRFSGLGYYLTENYLIVPCLLFLGYTLQKPLPDFTRRRLRLAVTAVSWFVIVQIVHKLSDMGNHSMAPVFFVYLMAFPFAVLADDRSNTGIRWIGSMFVAASLVLVAYSALLVLNRVPERLKDDIYWASMRLRPFWNPNVVACYFMIGIGFAAAFLARAQGRLNQFLLSVAIGVQLTAMALTNCRTALLLTGTMLGACLLLLLLQKRNVNLEIRWNGKWKLLILGILVVSIALAGTFKLSSALYQKNRGQLFSAQQGETGLIIGDDVTQGSLKDDMSTLNNRTKIWKAAISAVRNDSSLALWGTEYPGTVISLYSPFETYHAHNSWLEALLRLGIPGLLLSLVFTALSGWSAVKLILNQNVELWKKIIAMMTMCVMIAGFMEPYFFITDTYYHVIDFVFFFSTGYLDYWRQNMPSQKKLANTD